VRFQLGTRVRVPFGRQRLIGVVMEIADSSDLPLERLKPILEVLDPRHLAVVLVPGSPAKQPDSRRVQMGGVQDLQDGLEALQRQIGGVGDFHDHADETLPAKGDPHAGTQLNRTSYRCGVAAPGSSQRLSLSLAAQAPNRAPQRQ